MQNQPSLFTASASIGGYSTTVDLAKVAAMSVRPQASPGAAWWVTIGVAQFYLSAEIGDQIHAAWIAFQGKFDPQRSR